eukprot:TRINITY_DN16755_c0_g1_i1.p1 TRINITY_DN16755_c0_g1~~TRINITY_DN16755_c0_g1_i1.p1  ORF type:complete len:776 (-),score=118.56 TRINITY_DN16755_c0_g1_i1:251-2410(-)
MAQPTLSVALPATAFAAVLRYFRGEAPPRVPIQDMDVDEEELREVSSSMLWLSLIGFVIMIMVNFAVAVLVRNVDRLYCHVHTFFGCPSSVEEVVVAEVEQLALADPDVEPQVVEKPVVTTCDAEVQAEPAGRPEAEEELIARRIAEACEQVRREAFAAGAAHEREMFCEEREDFDIQLTQLRCRIVQMAEHREQLQSQLSEQACRLERALREVVQKQVAFNESERARRQANVRSANIEGSWRRADTLLKESEAARNLLEVKLSESQSARQHAEALLSQSKELLVERDAAQKATVEAENERTSAIQEVEARLNESEASRHRLEIMVRESDTARLEAEALLWQQNATHELAETKRREHEDARYRAEANVCELADALQRAEARLQESEIRRAEVEALLAKSGSPAEAEMKAATCESAPVSQKIAAGDRRIEQSVAPDVPESISPEQTPEESCMLRETAFPLISRLPLRGLNSGLEASPARAIGEPSLAAEHKRPSSPKRVRTSTASTTASSFRPELSSPEVERRSSFGGRARAERLSASSQPEIVSGKRDVHQQMREKLAKRRARLDSAPVEVSELPLPAPRPRCNTTSLEWTLAAGPGAGASRQDFAAGALAQSTPRGYSGRGTSGAESSDVSTSAEVRHWSRNLSANSASRRSTSSGSSQSSSSSRSRSSSHDDALEASPEQHVQRLPSSPIRSPTTNGLQVPRLCFPEGERYLEGCRQ